MKKVLKGLLAALFILPILTGGSGVNLVKADDTKKAADPTTTQTVNIDLHKLLFDNGTTPEVIPNDGYTKPKYTNNSVPLNGAEFTMYDVSTAYNSFLVAGKTAKEAVEAIQTDFTTYQMGTGTPKVTEGEGIAHFENVSLAKEGKFAAYLFVETKVPSGATERANPLVLAMPVYYNGVAFMDGNQDGDKTLDTINLYPKNVANELVKKEKNDTTVSYNIGEKVGYTVTVNVPGDAQTLFQVTDKPSAGLQTLFDADFVVKEGNNTLVKGTNYTVAPGTDGGYTLTLTPAKDFVGKQVTIKYNMLVTSAAPIDQGLRNNVSVDTDTEKNQEPDTPTSKVFTGGYNFEKKDGNSDEGLAGVKFKVEDERGNELKFIKNQNGEWIVADSTATGATTEVLTQDAGKLAITGLKKGNYKLVETSTLSDYVLPANPETLFTVKTNEEDQGTYTRTKKVPVKITNVKKGILPATGGTGIYAFLVIGAALMIVAVVWYKKAKDTAEV